jgi:pilus assembly protein CpaC
MRHPSLKQTLRALTLALAAAALAIAPAATLAQTPTTATSDLVQSGIDPAGGLNLTVNQSRVVTTSRPYRRVSVAQPDLATVNPVNPTSFLVTAKSAGATQIIVWDEAERSQLFDVQIAFDIKQLNDQFKTLFPGTRITPTVWNGVITLSGIVPDTDTADQITQIANTYSPGKVLNLLKLPTGQQVMLQVRFAEVSRSATTALGINLGYTDGTSFGGSNVGQVSPLSIAPLESVQDAIGLAVPPPSSSVTLFGHAAVGSAAIDAFVQALRQNNLLRVLAEPNLIASSGQQARFLAGGEFPVPVVQGGAGTAGDTSITVEYREFGVKLIFVPVVLGDGRIRMKIAPEVSDVDFSNAVRASGFLIPGRRTRNLETTIELASGQTFAVAGLLDNRAVSSKDVTPVLGDLPVLGALFRSVRYQRQETELVVLVTPRLVEPLNPDQVPTAPGEKWRHPSEAQLFLGADIGGPKEDENAPARKFIGKHGFAPAPAKND